MGKESLYAGFHVTYNGITDTAVGVHATTRPPIPAARENIQYFTVPGRDGTLTIKDGTVEDIVIQVDFSYTAYPDAWQDIAYAARDWLLGHNSATLRFSDLTGIFYKVKSVEVSDNLRQLKKIGTFSAYFTCEGYQYLDSGLEPISQGNLFNLNNQWAKSHPLYRISATYDGTCSLTVNGKTLKATIAQNLTIDTDLMMAYRTDNKIIMNTALIMGNLDYKDFWLPRGSNNIGITSGYTLQVVPNWRRL